MQNNSRKRKKKSGRLSVIKGIFLIIITVAAVGSAFASYYLKRPSEFWEEIIPIPEGAKVSVSVENGMTAAQAARAFEIQGALLRGSPADLSKWMVKFGIDRRIKAGHYAVVPSDAWNLARQLRTVKPALLKAQIVPGLDVFAVIESLESQDRKITRKAFCEALLNNKNYPPKMADLLSALPEDEETRVAFLMPETYMLVDRNADELVNVSASAWWNHWGDFISEHKLTSRDVQEASIVAAMVEREVLHDAECRTVAGVIHNRLRRNMKLQIDATVVYAWRLKGRKLTRVLYKDLEIDSPYNTYKIPGLPPRPICVPGVEAWGAALDPEDNEYLYYVADKSGYHHFAKTSAEHQRNIKQVRSER
ncbi:MAG: endolytic transglycosylase MltG [Synergistaceae bacterium]|nr:endolytic transglycosylase MltG [Synergistaceae bacterium]